MLTLTTSCRLSATRRKRKTPPSAATADEVKTFVQGSTIPSLHTTKPPGIAALSLAKDGELVVTGGCVLFLLARPPKVESRC